MDDNYNDNKITPFVIGGIIWWKLCTLLVNRKTNLDLIKLYKVASLLVFRGEWGQKNISNQPQDIHKAFLKSTTNLDKQF